MQVFLRALGAYRFSALYFFAIVFVNVLWGWYGEYMLVPTPWPGVTWAPLAVIVGLWFVLRDYAQMELGNYVLAVMAAGMLATWALAGPGLAIASCTAFIVGELCDWTVFSRLRASFARRVLISSLISVPVDTVLFLAISDMVEVVPGQKMLSWPTVLTEIASKLLAAYIVYLRIRNRTIRIGGQVVVQTPAAS